MKDFSFYLAQIDNLIIGRSKTKESIGLMGGKMGICIYYANKYVLSKESKYTELIYDELNEIINSMNAGNINLSFSTGLSGIVWGLKYLESLSIIDDMYEIIPKSTIQEILVGFVKTEFEDNNWDYLHGGFGGVIALESMGLNTDEYIIYLDETKSQQENGVYWLSQMYENQINTSISHGQITIAYFLLMSIRNKAKNYLIATKLLKSLISFMLQHMKSMNNSYLFDSFINEDGISRLGWCYGDLTIGYIFYECSKILNDKHLEKTSLEILLHTTRRQNLKENVIIDSSFCHGAVGIAYIYNKLYQKTNKQSFEDASNYWVTVTEKFLFNNDFKMFSRYDTKWEYNPFLLEGLAGIGLSLMSISNPSKSFQNWEECLLLN